MNIDEILVLGTGLSLFAGSKKEIARRAKASATMVNRTLRGEGNNTPTAQRILKVAKDYYEELSEQNEEYRQGLTAKDRL